MLSNETDAQAQRTATVVVERTTNIDLDVWELAGGRCWCYPQYSPRNKLINRLLTRVGGCRTTRASTRAEW